MADDTQVLVRCPQCHAEGEVDAGLVMTPGCRWGGFFTAIPEGQTEPHVYCLRCWQDALRNTIWPPPAEPVADGA